MGSIISAVCKCGFEKEKMFLGGGMMTHTHICMFINYCNDCNSMFIENMYKQKIICSKCNSTNTVAYDNPQVVKDFNHLSFNWNLNNHTLKLNKFSNLCPSCNNFTLEFRSIGSWD
jgi:hypothetical protein